MCDIQVPTLKDLCGNVLRGCTEPTWMRYPAPEFIEFNENGFKDMCNQWYYGVLFDYNDYTTTQLNPFCETKTKFPVVHRDLRYKRTFYLILDMEKLASYIHVMDWEEKRKSFLHHKNAPFLPNDYTVMANMAPGECFITWEKWAEYIAEKTHYYHPKANITPPLYCDCV